MFMFAKDKVQMSGYVVMVFKDNKWEAFIGFFLVHVISVLIVLFGNCNYYLK